MPKSRRRRVTMYPAITPAGIDLAALVDKRLAEIGPNDLLFPAPRGGWARRSNYGRNTWVTQDIYIHVNDDLYNRFYNATR